MDCSFTNGTKRFRYRACAIILAFFHENFFNGSRTLSGLECHEIAFYFLMKPKGKKELKSNSIATCGATESVYWLPIDKLKDYKFFPRFLEDKLINLPNSVEHIVTKG